VKIGPDLSHNKHLDMFVARVNAQGTSLDYCGFIGGDNYDYCGDIAADDGGHAYVAGEVWSTEATLPVKVGPDLTFNGKSDTLLAKVAVDGSELIYCGFIGGEGLDIGRSVAVDGDGCAIVTGGTSSNESSFPVKKGPELKFKGVADGFVAKVNPSGTDFVYCGYIGGNSNDGCTDIVVDGEGRVHVTGWAYSTEPSFPVRGGPDLTHNGILDTFVAGVAPNGTCVSYCGFIGGENYDYGHGIGLDGQGNVYVTSYTLSDESTFPVKVGPDLTFNGGGADAFVAKVCYTPALSSDVDHLFETAGGSVNFTLEAGEENGDRGYLLLGSITGTDPGMPLPGSMATLPLNWDGFTLLVVLYANAPIFKDFMGTLDVQGCGTAQLDLGPVPGFAGTILYFAFCLNKPFDYVSNPVGIEILP
jgi:hypothetical protein